MKFNDKGSTQRAYTKDGYLVVPASLSRVGIFDYLNSEVGKQGDGVTKVARTEKSLFTDETIKSFENAPLTIGHPSEDVTAKNWKQLAVGTMRNVKRDGDHLVGEAWINDEQAIKIVQEKGIDELSCGYSCDLVATSGNGADLEMSPMIGNHIAIVADGRCGSSCKLADQNKGKPKMSKNRKFLDAFLGAFGIKLTDEQAKKVEENEEETKPEEKPSEKAPVPPKKEEQKNEEPEDKEKTKVADAALLKQIEDLKAENQKLKDAQTAKDAETQRQSVLADAKANFSTVTFADSATVREIQESAVISQGIFTKDEAAKLSDAEISGAYASAKAVAKKLADKALGGVLLNDAKPAEGLNFNTMYNS